MSTLKRDCDNFQIQQYLGHCKVGFRVCDLILMHVCSWQGLTGIQVSAGPGGERLLFSSSFASNQTFSHEQSQPTHLSADCLTLHLLVLHWKSKRIQQAIVDFLMDMPLPRNEWPKEKIWTTFSNISLLVTLEKMVVTSHQTWAKKSPWVACFSQQLLSAPIDPIPSSVQHPQRWEWNKVISVWGQSPTSCEQA